MHGRTLKLAENAFGLAKLALSDQQSRTY